MSLANDGLTAVFSGGVIRQRRRQLDQNIGLSVTSGSVTLAVHPGVGARALGPRAWGRSARRSWGASWLGRRRALALAGYRSCAIAALATPAAARAGGSSGRPGVSEAIHDHIGRDGPRPPDPDDLRPLRPALRDDRRRGPDQLRLQPDDRGALQPGQGRPAGHRGSASPSTAATCI